MGFDLMSICTSPNRYPMGKDIREVALNKISNPEVEGDTFLRNYSVTTQKTTVELF